MSMQCILHNHTFDACISRQVSVFIPEHFRYPLKLNLPQVAEAKFPRLMDVAGGCFLYDGFMVGILVWPNQVLQDLNLEGVLLANFTILAVYP